MSDKYIFVVDTDQYAGNFEREMCACLTGQTGECGVGGEEVKKFIAEVGEEMSDLMDELVEQRPDDHGCHRPCAIYPTPGYFNHGLGVEFKDGEEEEALKRRNDYCEKQNTDFYRKIAEGPLTKHPSFQSVAIYFHKKPAPDIITMMIERAKIFIEGNDRIHDEPRTMKILGFRLLKETLTTEEVEM